MWNEASNAINSLGLAAEQKWKFGTTYILLYSNHLELHMEGVTYILSLTVYRLCHTANMAVTEINRF